MNLLTAVRNRISPSESSDLDPEPGVGRTEAGAEAEPGAEAGAPFAGYDRLNGREVIDALHEHSQVELGSIEGYERSHQEREAVLDKLRWMRGAEPFPGYDALSVEEIVSVLGKADFATVKKVRGYERKFASRAVVLEEVVRVQHRLITDEPAARR